MGSFRVSTDFFRQKAVYFVWHTRNPRATPFALLALLLLRVPLLFTLSKFVVLPTKGDRSHQFAAEQGYSP